MARPVYKLGLSLEIFPRRCALAYEVVGSVTVWSRASQASDRQTTVKSHSPHHLAPNPNLSGLERRLQSREYPANGCLLFSAAAASNVDDFIRLRRRARAARAGLRPRRGSDARAVGAPSRARGL